MNHNDYDSPEITKMIQSESKNMVRPLRKLPALDELIGSRLVKISKLETGLGGNHYIEVMQSFIDNCEGSCRISGMACDKSMVYFKRLIQKLRSLNNVSEIFDNQSHEGTVSILVGDAGGLFKDIADKITDPFRTIEDVGKLHEMCDGFEQYVFPILEELTKLSGTPEGCFSMRTLNLQYVMSKLSEPMRKIDGRGGRRTKHNKRSGHKRSGHKRSGHKSRRR